MHLYTYDVYIYHLRIYIILDHIMEIVWETKLLMFQYVYNITSYLFYLTNHLLATWLVVLLLVHHTYSI